MSDVIARKYVRALISSMDESELAHALESLKSIVSAYESEKFKNILLSSDVTKQNRENFILSMINTDDKKVINFLKLLNQNGRLIDLPQIVKELSNQISFKNNLFEGVLESNFEVDLHTLEEIQSSVSKKLNATIKLKNVLSNASGIKVKVESLGVEVGFSSDRLKAQVAEHILKSL